MEDVLLWPGNAKIAFDSRPTEDVLSWSGSANMAFDLQPTEDVLSWPGSANMAFDLDVLPWPGNANMAFELRSTEDVLSWPSNTNMAFDLDVLPWPGNANMAFDLRSTEDVLPWPSSANMAFDLVPDLKCLLRTWCEYGIRLSIGLATLLHMFYIRRYLRGMHKDNYNERYGRTADTKKESMSGRAGYRGRTGPVTADTKKENMTEHAERHGRTEREQKGVESNVGCRRNACIARASRVENQNAIEACTSGMLPNLAEITKFFEEEVQESELGSVRDDVQTDFLLNRQIHNGPFIINEILARCKLKKKQAMIFKVDFAKAYDSIRWDFLDDVLISFGFGSKWRSWIRGSLFSGKASILVNGSPTLEIFTGFRVYHSITLSHLFYADDAVFIGEWSHSNLKGIMNILRCFSLLSGMSINIQKSHLLGVGIPDNCVAEATKSIGCSIMKAPFKYLGILVGDNMSSIKAWDETISKMKKRLSRWKLNTLSVGGCLTLLKSMLGSTPIYNMSIFKVGKGTCTSFWNDLWIGDSLLKLSFPRLYALKEKKHIYVADKMRTSISFSFRGPVRGGVESQQHDHLSVLLDSVILSNMEDRWFWDLNGDGVFRVKDVRILLDEAFLPKMEVPTRWIKSILIKAFELGLHKIIHRPKPSKTIERHNGPKLSPDQTGYGPKAARRTKFFQMTLSQYGGITIGIPNQSTQKHSQKVKIAKAGIGNQDQRRGSQVGRRTTYLSHGRKDRTMGYANQVSQVQLYADEKREGEDERIEGPMIIEAEIGGHCIHRMYVDGGSASEILSSSSYNGIIGRPRVIKLQAVSSIAHRMLKLPVEEGLEVVRRFQEHKQSMPKRWLSATRKRMKGGIPVRIPFKCFLVAYKAYHKIQMVTENEEKTAFITSQGIFCYTKMPFGLRNARATYQRLVDKAFHKQIDRILEVYVDDLVIKSRKEDEIVRDIKETDFHWTAEAEEAFKQMKQLIAELPMLVAPVEREELIIYLAAAKETISAVLMMEKEAQQMPIYFVSKALRGPEINYTSMEKLVPALVHTSKRLKRYFQAHPIIVIMDHLIQQLLSKPEIVGRLQKWSIKLGEYVIHYRPRVSVKGHILSDFIVERPEEDSPDTLMETEKELPEPWILFIDGSSCTDGSGVGLILTSPEGMEFTYALRFRFDATNNEAEYEALIVGLRITEQIGDARTLIRACQDCQVHKPVPRNPQQQLTPITSPWPFYKWGIDIAGPFLKGPGKVKFLIVAIDYFTKWIDAKPMATITGNQVKNLCGTILENNFRTIHLKIGARNYVFANTLLLLSTHKPMVWWKEKIAALEVDLLIQDNEALEINLDLLEERREQAAIREAKSKAKMKRYYNSTVQNTSFKLGDLVYRNNDASRAEDTGKLDPKWEGPYKITEALRKGTYKLRDLDEKQLTWTWNISNLKKCYIHKM
nr:reverse transcriptase domain-containing protein [Tanacetum cinerariifolium]